jgi:hypothetical protein
VITAANPEDHPFAVLKALKLDAKPMAAPRSKKR